MIYFVSKIGSFVYHNSLFCLYIDINSGMKGGYLMSGGFGFGLRRLLIFLLVIATIFGTFDLIY